MGFFSFLNDINENGILALRCGVKTICPMSDGHMETCPILTCSTLGRDKKIVS